MPSHRYEWHEHIVDVVREFRLVRTALDRFQADVVATPEILLRDAGVRRHLHRAHENLEGTYLVRLFAAFEAALRSYARSRHKVSQRIADVSTLIDQIGGKAGRGIDIDIRQRAHEVRRVRNFWAHESAEDPGSMTIDEARARLQTYLCELPDEWD